MDALESRVGAIETLVSALDQRLRRIENPRITEAPPVQARPIQPAFKIPSTPPTSNYSVQPSTPSYVDAEYQIGAQWLPRIGATLMVLGISYLIRLAVQHGWITPIMLFCGAVALCLGLIGFGQWKRNEHEDFGQVVTGIGTCGMFITFAGGHIHQNLYSGETLVGLFLGWSLVNLTYAWWRGSRSFLGIGLFGGLIACWMPVQKDAFNLSLAFHALIALSTFAIVVRHRWPLMAGITWLSVLVSALPICMLASNEWLVRVIFVEGLGILATLAFIFACDAEEGKEKIAAILTMIGLSTGVGFLVKSGTLGSAHTLTVAAICAGLAVAFHERKSIAQGFGYAALGIATLLAPLGLDHQQALFAFAALSTAVSIASIYRKDDRLVGLSLSQLIVSGLIYMWLLFERPSPTMNVELVMVTSLGIASALAGITARRKEDDPRWPLAMILVGLCATRAALIISGDPLMARESTVAITTAWSLYAALLLAIGFLTNMRVLRYGALSVIFITVGKILVVDLATAEPEIRVTVLIGVGMALLAGGYWYIRRKGAKTIV